MNPNRTSQTQKPLQTQATLPQTQGLSRAFQILRLFKSFLLADPLIAAQIRLFQHQPAQSLAQRPPTALLVPPPVQNNLPRVPLPPQLQQARPQVPLPAKAIEDLQRPNVLPHDHSLHSVEAPSEAAPPASKCLKCAEHKRSNAGKKFITCGDKNDPSIGCHHLVKAHTGLGADGKPGHVCPGPCLGLSECQKCGSPELLSVLY